jgi:hypothetical protein
MLNTTHFHHLGSSLHLSARVFCFLVANNTSKSVNCTIITIECFRRSNGKALPPKSINYWRAIALQKEEGGRMGMGMRMVISTSFNVTWQWYWQAAVPPHRKQRLLLVESYPASRIPQRDAQATANKTQCACNASGMTLLVESCPACGTARCTNCEVHKQSKW